MDQSRSGAIEWFSFLCMVWDWENSQGTMHPCADKTSLKVYYLFSGRMWQKAKSSLYCERRVGIKKSINCLKVIMKLILKQSATDWISLERMADNRKCYSLVSLGLHILVSANKMKLSRWKHSRIAKNVNDRIHYSLLRWKSHLLITFLFFLFFLNEAVCDDRENEFLFIFSFELIFPPFLVKSWVENIPV